MEAMAGLTPGRVVHYVAYGTPGGEYEAGAHRAAIVTELVPRANPNLRPRVCLAILNPTGMHFNRNVLYSEDHAPGTWHWIERA